MQPPNAPQRPVTEVAIIGMAGRFPSAADVDGLWQLLIEGHEGLRGVSDEELEASGVSAQLRSQPGYVRKRGVLDRKLEFDAPLFGYTPADAGVMDPQFAVFHEVAWEALENAGYDSGQYDGTIGVYAGASASDGWLARILDVEANMADRFSVAGLNKSGYLSTRVAHRLDLTGPALTINTTCSTSLVAIHAACQALIVDDCTMALAGGVSVSIDNAGYAYQDGMVLAPDGTCRPFDVDANGTGAGEGCGVLVLKRLDRAVADNDRVLAVVKGSAINNDGRNKVGFAAPSVDGQAQVIAAALQRAQVAATSIGYVEAHGTGTRLGDPIEIAALKRIFANAPAASLPIGSVKSNLGHLGEAAGVAGVIKAVLALGHGSIPPTLHYRRPNPLLELEGSALYVADRQLPLRGKEGNPARVGVSSFGIGGTNAHVILEAADDRPQDDAPAAPHLVCLSAASASALAQVEHRLIAHAASHPRENIADLCHTLQVGRRPLPHRTSFVVSDSAALAARQPAAAGAGHVAASAPAICLLFPGQGTEYAGMGRDLHARGPVFRQYMEQCLDLADGMGRTDLREAFLAGTDAALMRTDQVQPLLFAAQYALAQQLMHWGCRPHVLLGHSVGEYAAACLAGVFSLHDAFALVVERGRLMQTLPAGRMMAVALDEQQLLPLLSPDVAVAAVNSPLQTVVAGEPATLDALQAQLRARGTHTAQLPARHAFHSHHIDRIVADFEQAFEGIVLREPALPIVSSLSGNWVGTAEITSAGYWSRQMRETVRYGQAVRTLCADSTWLMVETGPGAILAAFAAQNGAIAAGNRSISMLPSREHPEYHQLLAGLGQLFEAGVTIDWTAVHAGQRRRRVALPTYPFEGRRHYPEHLVRGIPRTAGTGTVQSGDAPAASAPVQVRDLADVEEQLTTLWRTFIGNDQIQRHDDVFDHGIDSLMSIRVITEMRGLFGLDITLEKLFTLRTIASQAEEIERLSRRPAGIDAAPPIARRHGISEGPLSASQKRMWIISQLEEDSSAYNTGFHHFIRNLDRQALQRTLQAVVQRHEVLRTVYHYRDGGPRQVVQESSDVPIEQIDIRALAPEAKRHASERIWQDCLLRRIDLERDPMLRACVVHLDEDLDLLIVTQHHISADNWSLNLLIDEIAQGYERELHGGAPPPPLPLQYLDYALWQQEFLSADAIERALPYWKKRLHGAPALHRLPLDAPRPARQSYRGTRLHSQVGRALLDQLQQLGQRNGATLFMVMQAAFSTLLSRYSGEQDIVTGFPVANRQQAELEGLIGCFVNTLVSRSDTSSDPTFTDFLLQTRSDLLAAYAHQQLPFETLVEHLNPPRSLSHEPVVQIMLVYLDQSHAMGGRSSHADRSDDAPLEQGEMRLPFSKYDLTLYFSVGDDGLALAWEFATDLFAPATITRIAQNFGALLAGIAAAPDRRLSQLPLLSGPEQRLLAECGNLTATDIQPTPRRGAGSNTGAFNFSLFFFASDNDNDSAADRYRLLTEGARFADLHGFQAVWMPERHFGDFGGAFPNPAVTAALIAGMTSRVGLRAGSCVLPLHNPLRLAEDWSVVDNVSGGRVGIGFAAGFSARDFVLAPDRFDQRRQTLAADINTVKSLWRGEAVSLPDGNGTPAQVRIRPRPVQAALPVWVTTAGGEEGFRRAGQAGDNVLTHMMGQTLEELRNKIGIYRQERAKAGHDGPGTVTLLVHTFLAASETAALAAAKEPFKRYLVDSVGTPQDVTRFIGQDTAGAGQDDVDAVIERAFDRYYNGSTLMGTLERCQPLAEAIRASGVNEVACLIDFGVPADQVLAGLDHLRALRECVLATPEPAAVAPPAPPASGVSSGIALTLGDGTHISRAALDESAQALARTLTSRGLTDSAQRIALHARAGLDLAVGLLAILRAGACCVLLDIDDDDVVRERCIEADVACVLASPQEAIRLSAMGLPALAWDAAGDPEGPAPATAAHDGMACVLFDADDTAMYLTHATVARLSQRLRQPASHSPAVLGLDPALSHANAFVAWLRLLAGDHVVLLPCEPAPPLPGGTLDEVLVAADWPTRCAGIASRGNPARVRVLGPGHPDPHAVLSLQRALPDAELLREHTLPGCVGPMSASPLLGPTSASATLGRPHSHVRAYLLDGQGQLVPHGAVGRLWLAGACVADGYLDRPGATAIQFARDATRQDDASMCDAAVSARWTAEGHLQTADVPLPGPAAPPARTAAVRGRDGQDLPSSSSSMAVLEMQLAAPDRACLRAFADRSGATLHHLLFAVMGVLLHRYTAQEDLVLGWGADATASPLPLHLHLPPERSFSEHLREVQAVCSAARRLPSAASPPPAGTTVPPAAMLVGAGSHAASGAALSARWRIDGQVLHARLCHDTELHDTASVKRWAIHFRELLVACIAQPDAPVAALPMLPAEEAHALQVACDRSHRDYGPATSLHRMFEASVDRHPDRTALVCGSYSVSYAELDVRANQLAHALSAQGALPGALIGLCLARSPDLIVAMLAVLKCGAAYLPLDPGYPANRLRFMLDDARPVLVLTQPATRAAVAFSSVRTFCLESNGRCWGQDASVQRPSAPSLPEDLAYVLYTSGSTGQPKGVMIEHRNVTNLVHWGREFCGEPALARTVLATSINFDLAAFELYVPLCAGTTVVLVDDALSLTARDMPSQLTAVPSIAAALIAHSGLPDSLQWLNLAGEAVAPALLRRAFEGAPHRRICNAYGPTETTTFSTAGLMRSDAPDDVHIGRAIANTRLLVLDRVGCRVPVGVVGELHIGGAGVSRGYLNRPDLTAERFVDDPSGHSGDRLYRTGDLVRWRPDGCLDYIGRMDQQVKVRGFRIEPGEIEATLLAQTGVSEAVVSVHAAHGRDRKLIAHVTGHGLRAGQLKQALAEHLPEHMVPAVIDVLEQMPRLPNGKLDRNALPRPSDEGPTSAGPDNDSQSRLAALFSQVLGVSEVGVHDDFYARGGHSLLAIELLGLVNATFGTELVLRDMFQSRTVAELSVLIEQNRLVERLLVHVDEDDSTLETFEF